MSDFERAFRLVVGEEGGLSLAPADPGNWTGGRIGVGRLVGTKYGVSAASYPTLDIPALTLDAARAIYRHDFWDRIAGDALPPRVALLAFDAAVNQGVTAAVELLQAAAGAAVDGLLGPRTLAALQAADPAALAVEFWARRALRYARAAQLGRFGLGWFRRLARIGAEALSPSS